MKVYGLKIITAETPLFEKHPLRIRLCYHESITIVKLQTLNGSEID